MEKIAKRPRKPSNDPAQEKLRQAKDAWNEKASTVIAGLIALKRGLNGRGDPKAGLPPSSIKEPLPPQVGQYLSEMSNQFLSVIDEARKIIDGQTYYSTHRRKSKKEGPQMADDGLIAEASWWGSRAWARISLLRKINGINRRLRLNLLDSLVEVEEDLKKFEGRLLDYKDPDSVPSAITALSSLMTEYVSALKMNLDKLEDVYQIIEKQKDQKKPSEETAPPAKDQKKPAVSKEAPPESTAPAESVSEQPTVSVDVWEAYKNIYSQLVKIGVIHSYILNNIDALLERNTNVTGSYFEEFQSIYHQFTHNIFVFHDLSSRTDHDKTVIELENMAKDIISQYKSLLQLATQILGPANDFNELVKKIHIKVSAYLEVSNNQEELRKLAAGVVSRWLNKVWMSINPDNIARMKLELINISTEVRKLLELLMDTLENREADFDEIALRVSKVNQKMLELIDLSVAISKLYMIDTRRQPKDRKFRQVTEIKLSDINVLKDIRKEIDSYIIKKKDNG